MTRTLPLSEVKIKFSRLVADVLRRDDEIIITRNGRPAAVLMSAQEYEGWKETQEIKRDPELMEQIRQSLREFAKGKTKTFYSTKELFGEDL